MRVTDSIKQPEAFLLWNDEHTFNRLNELYKLVYVGYFSLWIGLLAYNGFLYAVLRRRDYLFYLFYLLSMGAAIVTASDLSTIVLPWPHWPLRGIVVIVCLNLTTFNLVRFSRVFLDTAARAPLHDRWLMRLGWVVLGASLASPAWLLPGAAVGYEAFDLALNIVVMVALPILGLTLFYRRNSQAGLYVLTFLPLAAAVIYALNGNFGMPEARVNGAPVLSANALELVLLALALAWRYRRINDEALGLRSEYTARLEDEVTLRTRELRESNNSLARANRDKDRIFGIIGHDLRGPAQSLFGLAQILSADPDAFSPQESASMAKEIEATCRNQLELLENLLLWGRMQSGGLRVRPEPQAAADIVGACTGALMPAIRSKNITFAIEIEPGLTFNADSQAAQAVVRNLLVNALKFTRSGGKITVAALRKGNQVELSVQDNGVGMSAARLGELFAGPVESMAGTRSETGAGVGLTLCRDLARANGGDLRIESEPGSGTKVTLILPVSVASV